MTDEKTRQAIGECAARVDRIFDLALTLTEERLSDVDPKDKKDSMAFDRIARTAQVFLNVVGDAAALSARMRKEVAGNAEGVQVRLPTVEEVDGLERAIVEAAARSKRRSGGANPEDRDRTSAPVPGVGVGGMEA